MEAPDGAQRTLQGGWGLNRRGFGKHRQGSSRGSFVRRWVRQREQEQQEEQKQMNLELAFEGSFSSHSSEAEEEAEEEHCQARDATKGPEATEGLVEAEEGLPQASWAREAPCC